MLAIRSMISSSQTKLFLLPKRYFEPISITTCDVFLQENQNRDFLSSCIPSQRSFEVQFIKQFHTSNTTRDLESSIKTVGAGLAMIGAAGPGVGLGVIFGSTIMGTARNPSNEKAFLKMALLGAAFCEGIALFSMLIAIMILN